MWAEIGGWRHVKHTDFSTTYLDLSFTHCLPVYYRSVSGSASAVGVQPEIQHGHGDRPGVVRAVEVEVGAGGCQEPHREEAVGAAG